VVKSKWPDRELVGEMVEIPGGAFRMGDLAGDRHPDERPVREVAVRPFRLGKHEVTVAQWDRYRAENPRAAAGAGGPLDHPVTEVSWQDVQGYLQWLNGKTGGNYRLPSEAEWEYAARAGSATKYPWGDVYSADRANGSGISGTAPVGSFPANHWKLHDMIGNVWEWTADCWNESYAGAPTDGRAWTQGDCARRVVRGGGYNYLEWNLRVSNRNGYYATTDRVDNVGFRLAQDR